MAVNPASSLLRANQAYYELLAKKHTLDDGIVFYHPNWADLPDAAQVREVVTSDPRAFSRIYETVEEFFYEQGLICRRWAPALDEPVEALTEFLERQAYRRRDIAVMVLPDWPDRGGRDDVRVLPARPMREAYQATFLADGGGPADELQAAAAVERLNEASLDVFVALDGTQPVGRGGIFQVGDIGLVCDVYVIPQARRQGVGTALLGYILNFARRLAPRIVCTQADLDNQSGIALLKSFGFVLDQTICEFDRIKA